MILVIINFIAAVPVFMSDRSTFLPFLMLDVCVIVVMVLRKGAAAHKACGEDCERALAFNVIRPNSVIKKTLSPCGCQVRR